MNGDWSLFSDAASVAAVVTSRQAGRALETRVLGSLARAESAVNTLTQPDELTATFAAMDAFIGEALSHQFGLYGAFGPAIRPSVPGRTFEGFRSQIVEAALDALS
jgi:hypothetical protein